MEEIKILYHNKDMPKLENIGGIDKSAMIDLYTAEDYELEVGKFYLLNLGVSMKLPESYQANIVPRSSTFKKFGLIQCNHYGVIDNSYSSAEDIWKLPVFAPLTQEDIKSAFLNIVGLPLNREDFTNGVNLMEFRKIKIPKYTRLCQFEIKKTMPDIKFIESDLSEEIGRGGFGSTGF